METFMIEVRHGYGSVMWTVLKISPLLMPII